MPPGSHIIDLTVPFSMRTTPSTVYPGHPLIDIASHATVAKDGYTVHSLHFGTHAGTHMDAPSHFVEGGRSIDQVELEELRGRALIVDLTRGGTAVVEDRRKFEWEDLEQAWKVSLTEGGKDRSLASLLNTGEYSMLLVHTGWSTHRFPSSSPTTSFDPSTFFSHPYFSSSIAQRLASPSSKIKLFGSDTPNPDETPYNGEGGAEGYGFHKILLGADGLIAENLTGLDTLLKADLEGEWIANIIPLKIEGVDGSPIRAFAHRREA